MSHDSGRGPHPERRPLPQDMTTRFRAAWAVLFWERLWATLWPGVGIIGLFLAIALLDLLPALPGWLHLLVIVVFAAGLVLALRRRQHEFKWPDADAAQRRIETASGLTHRPILALRDRLAVGEGDPASEAVWNIHRRRMLAATRRLRIGIPAPGLARLDPLALRSAILLILLVVGVIAWEDGPARLARAVTPDLDTYSRRPVTLDIWITPPAYTELGTIFLDVADGAARIESDDGLEAGDALDVPAGSTVSVQLHGGRGTPGLRLDDRRIALDGDDKGGYQVNAALGDEVQLVVEQGGRLLAGWRLSIRPDAHPNVDFLGEPAQTSRAVLKLDYEASDDYGLERIEAVIRRVGRAQSVTAEEDTEQAPPEETINLELPIRGLDLTRAQGVGYFDLTPHPWAGLAVTIELSATDTIQQIGRSDQLELILPERFFRHPLAKAIIAQRKRLSINPRERDTIAVGLRIIAARAPEYIDDVVVYLALSVAEARLLYNPEDRAVREVQKLLWNTALRIEDGDLSLAARDLRGLQQRLADALIRGAPEAEIEQLMEELLHALDRYLQALVDDMQKRGPSEDDIELLRDDNLIVDRDDLRRLVEQARDMARTGAREAARQLLSQLQDILENLRAGLPDMLRFDQSEGEGLLQELQDLINSQQGLLDQTYKHWQERMRNSSGILPDDEYDPGSRLFGAEQEDLRRLLGDLMRRLGDMIGLIPDPLGNAERAMRQAAEALGRDQPWRAIQPQGNALDYMREGGQAALEELIEQMAVGGPESRLFGEGMGRGRSDPLGRPLGTQGGGTSDVGIPDQAELQRVREILDELRRRARDRRRPRLERDYIERLLRRF